MFRRNHVLWLPCAVLAVAAGSAFAAEPNAATALKQAFDAAWQRQPEALSQQARLDAAAAQLSSFAVGRPSHWHWSCPPRPTA